MTTILSDEEFFGTTAPAKPAAPKTNGYLSDDEFFAGSPEKPTAPEPQSDPGLMGGVRDFGRGIARGFNRLQQSGNVLLEQAGLISPEDAAQAIARDEADVARYPASKEVQQGQQEIAKAGGWGSTALAILTNPRTLATIVGESLPASTAMQAVGFAAGMGGFNPVGLVAGTGFASFAIEYSSTILDTMRDAHVDINDPAQVEAAMKDPEFMRRAAERGMKRGIPIGVFDGISFGLAGRISKMIEGGAETISTARKIAGEAGEVGAQAVAGGTGEAGGELADTGTLNPSDVLLEAGAEVFTGLPEIALGRLGAEGEGGAKPERQPASAAPAASVPQGAAPAETLFGQEADAAPSRASSPPAVDPSIDRPDSPRLTPEDRASPLPNNLIDDGKAIIEDALAGRPLPTGEAATVEGTKASVPFMMTNDMRRQLRERGVSDDQIKSMTPAEAQSRLSTKTGSMRAVDEIGDRVAADITSEFAALPDHEVLTTPTPAAEPTPAQAEAGNYQKRHVQVNGLDVSIENEAGSVRRGVGEDGTPWEVTMPVPYGYIKRTAGADGDQVDVYLGPHHSDTVYVIDQIDPATGKFDEHKAMLGFTSETEAVKAYDDAFSDGKGLDRIGAVTAMPTFGFKHWVKNGDTSGPLSYTPKAPQAAAPTPASPEPTPVDVRDRKVTRKTPLDLIEFVASLGGIKDVKGELRALDLHKKFVPGIGRLVRESGLDPDKAREAAEEAGYISPTEANFTTTTRDLFDAMERTARGDRVFARSDMAAVERGKAGKVSEEDQAREAEWEEVRALGLSPDEEEQIKALVGDGWWPSEAAAEVLGRDAAEEIGRPIEEFIDEEIPFEPGQARGGAEGEKPVGRSAPADEAPKEGGAAGRGKQDAPRKIENAGAVARDEVLKRGRATGNEHLMLISPDGSSAFELAGSPTNTGSSPEMFKVMNDPASDVIAHHNHPSSRSLSNSDVSFLVRPGMSAVWAHGHDGTSSRASFTDKAKKVFTVLRAMATANGALALAQETLQKILPRYEGRSLIYEAINLRFQAKEISADDASVMESVARNEALHRAGLIDFFTTIPRHAVMDDPLIQTAIERQATNVAEQIFGNDAEIRRYDRPAIPIRHAGDVGVVQEGGREPAANRAGEGAGRDQKGGALGSFGTVDAPNVEALGKAFGDYLVSPANRFNTIVQARNFAAEKLGGAIKAGTPAAKAIDEAIELGVVRAAREIVEAGRRRQRSRIDIFNDLLGLYDRQPSLAVRTSTSVQNQAYSTPVPLAYVASRLALVDKKSSVLEPTAGNGALLIEANPEKTTANELDPARAAALTSQGFRVSQKDAAEGSLRHGGYPVDVVIANPPFGAVQENGASKRFKVDDRYTTTEIDHAIALKSLEAMADDGRAVLLLGGVNKLAKTEEARSDAYNGKAKREFYYTLYNAYNVVDHFTVSGDLYQKQGAGWPIDVIVIRGKGKSARKLPAADVPRVLNSWEDVKELLHAEYPETARPAGQPSERPAGKPAEEPATQRNAQSEAEVRGGGPAVERDGDQGGRSAVVQPRSDERGAVPEDQPATVAGDGGAGSEDAGADSGRADVGIAVEADDSDEVVNQRMTAEGPWDFNDTYPEPDWEKLDAAEREGRYPLDTGEGPDGRPDATQIAATIEETMQELQVRNLDMAEANRRIEGLRSGSIKPRKRGGKVEDEIRGLERSIKEDQQAIEDTEAALGEVWPDDAVQAIMVEARRRAGVEASQTTTFEGRVPKAERKADEPEAPKPAKPEPKAAPDAKQVSYKPKSAGKGMGTLVPVNMQSTTQAALDTLEERVGPLDNFVGKELGYSKAELDKYFGAEQIDGIALAIDNFSKGAGFIIGDQTGIGKGRQVAAVLRWAMRNGKTPIFVTEKPNLYGDMYRDLTDIGVKNPRIFMTNSGENIPLNEEQTVSLKTPSAAIHNAAMNRMAAAGKLDDKYDLIFTTYNQMQTIRGEPTARMTFLRAMATANGALALDESHNAGGTEAGTMGDDDKMTRAKFVRELVGTADAVLYSSATYAKRPSVMDLYAKTDMRLAVDDIGKLGDLIARGGVPMQQIVAAQLSQAGQYARRERSFDGVVYDSPVVEVNKQTYERFSSSIKMIQTFSEDFVNEATKGISKELKADAKSVSRDGSTGGAGASSTNFTAIMHNVINQMLLAIKADTAVDYALDAIKRGEKPVITLANTLESFLDEYADTRGLRPGDALSLDFGELLQRYLDRSRVIIIKKPFSKEPGTRHRLTDEELGPMGVRAYEEAKKQIAGTDFGKLPVSPIDWIKARLTREGVKVGEITGRNMIVDYRADGAQILAMRPSAEKSITGRRKSIADFNNGNLDVLILNQAGATGLSLHASEKVKDQRKRHMILAQAEGNIDTHMQMLGRVHRTGQVVTPRYSQLVAGIPAEKRPASVLAKKMASLNANTTASRGGALTAKDVPDFMNEYGDQVAARVMNDNPDLHEAIGEPLEYGTSGYVVENAMRKVTGRIPLLPLAQQEALYEMLESEYAAYIEQLEASGENALEAKTLPLDARTIEHRQVKEPVNADSPFADGVYFDKVDVKQLGKPQSSLEVLKAVAAELAADITPTKESAERDLERLQAIGWKKSNDAFSKAREEFTAYRRDVLDNLKSDEAIKNQRTKLDDILNRWNGLTQVLRPGVGVKLMTNNIGNLYGIVISVSRTGTTKNPLAMGAWKVKVALADSIRQITLPFSTLYTARTAPTTPAASDIEIGTVNSIGSMPLIRAFDDMQQDRREERTIVTGNILAGYDMLNGRGQIINYVDHENAIRQGILLKRDFDQDAFLGTRPVKLVMSDHILRYLEAAKEPLYSTDRNAGVRLLPNGDVRIITDGSKAKGGQYFLNRNVLDAAGRDFVKAGGEMRLDVPPTTALRVLDAMKKAGASFEATTKLDIAREITGERGPMAQLGERTPEATGESVAPRLKDSFKARANRLGPRLRAELDRIGLRDVGLRLAESVTLNVDGKALPADAVYFEKLIQFAIDQDNPISTLHHEALHALRDLGLFTKTEWAMLERKARKEWMTRFDIADAYGDFPEWAQMEEAIAHAFAEWQAGRQTDGMIARLFKRIVAALRAIRAALSGEGFRSIDEVFEAIDRGVVGSRERVTRPAGMEMGAVPPKSVSETVETVDGKREQLVIPGAEKISDKQLAERRGEGKMQPTKPQKGVEGLGLFDDGTPERGQLKLFKLRRAPKDAGEAQEAMQGFIARGQPIDRAIRIPFDILGGIDEQGRWMPGKRLIDKLGPAGLSGGGLGGIVGAGVGSFVAGPVGTVAGGALGGTVGAYLLGAKINVGDRFPWLDGVLENFRRGLIDRYGLDTDYVDMDRKRALDQRAVLQQADGILKVLANSNVGPKEAAVLQAVLTGERVDDKDMALLAVPIRQAIDDLGAEAVSLGLISAESFERNRGAYLHRVYQKNEIEDGTLAGWVSRRMTSRRRRIMGDEMKGRGMFWDLSVDRLMRDVPGWKEAARGTPVNGEKFRVLDNVLSPTDDMLTGEERGRVARRIYLPADEMVPPKYTGPEWRDRGVWEVRGTKKGQVTLWRDYTKAEREKMGEIVDARYTIAKTFMLMANDLSTGRFFKQVGENENWARSMQPPDGQWKTAEAYSRYWNDTSIGWVKVPDTVISGAGGRKRWGGLAGKYVRAEIWRDLNELDIAQNPGTWRRLYQQWKRNKTARNPVVHMNNIMSNLMFMDLADVRLQDLVAGIKAYHSGGKDFQEARDNGAFGADMMTQEIRDNVLKPILEEIAKQAADGRSTTPFLEKAGALGVFADKLWTWAKTADEGMLRAYQIEDEIFRMATYMRRRQQGETPRVAAMNAHDQFLNYDIRAPWIVAARNTVFPFISYTYRAVPKLAEGIAHRPWKVAKYFALAYIANALAYAGDDGDDGEDRERAALRDEEQGWTWIGVPRMVRMPFRDEHGLPVFLDVRRWIPAGDIFDTSQGSSAIPIPAPLQFGGPMVLAAEFLLNRQAFTGGDITNDLTDDNADKAENVADWAWKSWAPNAFWVPNSWYWQKVRNAVVGATDAQGRQYSVGQAFLSSIGVKVRPLDVEDGLSWHSYEFKQVQKALRADLRAAGRKLDRGLISQAEYDRQQAKIMEKFANLERTADEFEARSQPKR